MKLLTHSIEILYYLFSRDQNEEVFINFFTGHLDRDYPYVSQLISELANKDLLTKEKLGRSTRVTIIEEGRAMVQEHAREQIAKIQEYFELFNDTFRKGTEDLGERLKILRDYFIRMRYLVIQYDGIHEK